MKKIIAKDQVIAQMMQELEKGNADFEHYHEKNAYEIESYVRKGMSLQQAIVAANNPNLRFQKPSQRIAIDDGYADAAEFNILVTRLTANINEALPVPVFGATALQSGYYGLLDFISASTSIVAFNYGINDPTLPNPNKLRITYDKAGAQDIVEIACSEIPYPNFIAAMQGNDLFELSKIRISLSDATKVNQFQQRYVVKTATLFGLQKNNPLPVSSAKSPDQFQDGIVDVKGVQVFNKQKFLQMNILNVAEFSVTLSFMVRQFEKDAV